MTIKVTDFDGIESTHANPIHLVMHQIKLTAPIGAKVSWQYPGYISIVLSNGTEIAFGESLENDGQYSWNSYDLEGNSDHCNSFDDLRELDLISKELWNQTKQLLENEGE